MSKKLSMADLKQSLLMLIMVVVTTISIVIAVVATLVLRRNTRVNDELKAELGTQAVMAMYDFGTVEQLDAQMLVLKGITTDAVYNQLTIDNSGRALNTYLKFSDDAVSVNVIEATSDYVIYSLDTEAISAERKFIFIFSVNDDGLISSVREMEAIDFVDTY